jgi:2-dehydro-3-deoxyphosphogluconate aldolase/(4S)-4-hydroxy-2-oxoglutarate aldolase
MMITKPDFLPAHTKWYSAPDRTQLSGDLSQYLTDELQRVLVHNQRASLALSGSRTSIPLLQALAQESLPWQNIEITLTDERWVDEDHNDSNAALVQRYLLQRPASSACFIPLKNQAICHEVAIIPVLSLANYEETTAVGQTFVKCGLSVLEVTLRNNYARQAITQLKAQHPHALVGAGTVTNIRQYQDCVAIGADFVVSPGSTTELLQYGQNNPVPLLPGVSSVSEAMGYQRLKLLPAAVLGGVKLLQALQGPLPELKFCPTGAVTAANASHYLQLPNVMCVGGTWLTPIDAIR